jgi:hypothetical protein
MIFNSIILEAPKKILKIKPDEDAPDYTDDDVSTDDGADTDTTDNDTSNDYTTDENDTDPSDPNNSDDTDYTAGADDTDDTGDDDQNTDNPDQPSDDTTDTGDSVDLEKNYTLIGDFISLYKNIKENINRISTMKKADPLATSIIAQVIKNMTLLSDNLFQYVYVIYSTKKYIENLYQFNCYIEMVRVNIEMLKKIKNLSVQ